MLALQPFSVHVGPELLALEPGQAELAINVEPHLEQQNGFVHGGIVSYLVDHALTFAGGSVLGPNVLTQEFKVSYLRPAKGERLIARASVLYSSKRQAVCRCDVYGRWSGDAVRHFARHDPRWPSVFGRRRLGASRSEFELTAQSQREASLARRGVIRVRTR